MKELKNFRVAVLATDGFEEAELMEPVKALKDAVEGSALKGDAFTRALAKAKYAAASTLEGGREASSAVLAYKVRILLHFLF